ncbi:MAG: hypothetical protein ACTSYG_07360 [Candidatus Heimdallarchaeota archaeon]
MAKEKEKKMTETYYDVARKEGMTSARALKVKAKEMIPVVGFRNEVRRVKEEAQARGLKPIQVYIQRRKEQLLWGTKKAASIIASSGQNLVTEENPTGKKITKEVKRAKKDIDDSKKAIERMQRTKEGSKAIKVSSHIRKGRPVRTYSRSKPKKHRK